MNPNNVNPIHSSVEVAVAVAFAFIVIRNTVLIYSNEWNNEVVCLNGTCCLLVKQASFVLFFCIHHPIPLEHSHISYQFNLSTNPHIFTCFFFDCANFIFMWMITNYVTSNAFLKRKKSRVFFRYCWSICKLGLFSLRTFFAAHVSTGSMSSRHKQSHLFDNPWRLYVGNELENNHFSVKS